MPKSIARSKTRKAVAKRFKITGTGKVLRSQATRRHLMATKSAKRKRQLAKSALVHKTDEQRVKANLPFA
ncbi:MAG: 50S ribosomal protein L35 [Verrucomicrobiota bacterium]|jgi:large subunit ribosomal protein L35|nr:50S ribosomal protein L35 [Chthoniobacterales bacterium]MDQ3545932.1 50S ribosomal protein L35 [Verrucomicrobiota bacterium]